jgi:STE24 endopeptidase
VLVLAVSPIFIRMAWPTRSMPDGPLRRRLESVSRRSGFRCADILVWDTDHLMVNACVTGILPRFRYVLLSDALIDSLTPLEIAAVFGHEIGHVAHRHLQYFLFFFVGCLAVLTMASDAFAGLETWIATLTTADAAAPSALRDVIEGLVVLAAVGAFFGVVFGHLSRRFERQADVYGCKVVSCGSPDCPPHFDFEGPTADPAPIRGVCPAGVQIFADALATVAQQNGIDADSRSWRHGSIASRRAFLQRLAVSPEREVAFQRQVRNVRYGLGAGLVASIGLAGAAHWLGVLR